MNRPWCEQVGARLREGHPWRRAAAAAKCRRGATALEFAVISSFLIPFLMVCMEMSLQSWAAVALDGAAFAASRTGSLGRLHADGTRSGQACKADVEAAANQAGRGILYGKLTLDAKYYGDSYSAGADTDRTKGGSGAGSGGHTVVYQLNYEHPFVFAQTLLGLQATKHSITFTVQNEPFNEGKANATPCA